MESVKGVFWHRELPPINAELMAEHSVEANSSRVAGTLAHRDELWDRCYQELMANAGRRISDEVATACVEQAQLAWRPSGRASRKEA